MKWLFLILNPDFFDDGDGESGEDVAQSGHEWFEAGRWLPYPDEPDVGNAVCKKRNKYSPCNAHLPCFVYLNFLIPLFYALDFLLKIHNLSIAKIVPKHLRKSILEFLRIPECF